MRCNCRRSSPTAIVSLTWSIGSARRRSGSRVKTVSPGSSIWVAAPHMRFRVSWLTAASARARISPSRIQLVKKSVQQLLKQADRVVQYSSADQYDLIYCAGLFDYLSNKVCRKLMEVFYAMLAPGGLRS